ncbi:MAG: hypothetical protein VX768_00605 [Planctomycetota bacterium]|nr:hypothetical protein [Planctomycetota bacterium]
MNQRTFYLLMGAGVVAVLYFGDQAYRGYVEEPAAEREKQLKKVASGIRKANDLIAESLSVEKQLDSYERMSLPYDTEVTRTRYQGWLLSLVKSVGMTGTSIDAGQPSAITIKRQKPKKNQSKRKLVMYRYGYSLRCRGSLQQLVTFLYRFYRSGQLHKIRSISMNPSSGGTIIDTSLAIEALALVRTERETRLSTELVKRLKHEQESHYVSIARRNIFSRTGSTILQQARVTAITFGKSGKPQVWIKSGTDEPSRVFHNDEKFVIQSHQVEVLDIQSRLVLLLIDGAAVKVSLGHPLAKPPSTGPAKAPQPEEPATGETRPTSKTDKQ